MRRFDLFFIFLAAAACSGCNTPSATSNSLQAALYNQYSLSLLRPPSTLYAPGTVAQARIVDPGTATAPGTIVSLSRYCQPGSALPLASVAKSQTNDLVVSYNVSVDASAKAEIQSLVQLGAGINYIDKIDITLSNPVLYRPDDPQLQAALGAIKQSGCSLSGRVLVTAVLQADVSVKTSVGPSANLSVSEAKALQSLVGASFGANFSSADNQTMTGKGLFYGVELARPL